MSRYNDSDYDGDYWALDQGRWERNSRAVLKSKRGRKALADLREALLALPEPRLIEGALCTVNPQQRAVLHLADERGEGVCAIGAYLWHQKVKAGMDPAEAFDSLPTLPDDDSELHDTASLGRSAGLAYTLAWELAYRNDETFRRMTPEERYTAFLAWIDAELGELAGSAA